MKLTEADFEWAAKELGCEVAVMKAVDEVESKGHGFLPSGIPVVLFEAHIFSKLTNGAYNKSHPSISSTRWNRKLYATGKDWIERGKKEAQRQELAASLDRNAALQSCSYGRFQVMGFNWEVCGYKSLRAFINTVYRNERGQLEACVGYIKGKKLDRHLRNKNWDAFAAGYNGKEYKQNKYDEKLEDAYLKYSKGNS